MKKILALMMVLALVLTTGIVVYAESEEVPEWFTQMLEWRRDRVDEALEAEEITADEAEAWLEHLDEMEAYRLEEGFENFGPGSGCRGGSGFGGFQRGSGFGGGGCGRRYQVTEGDL